jgi:molybdate transport system ATP-binding protein
MATTLTVRIRRHNLDVDIQLPLTREAPVVAIFGPSGAGKTTLLRCVAGLDTPMSGSHIAWGGQVWFGHGERVPARKRHVGYLFQEHALFPHLSVAENVAYGIRSTRGSQRQARVIDALAAARAGHLAGTRVDHLSGGEAQRVALARALATRPQLLLLDEPLSALDQPTRARLQGELREILRASATPTLLVTHDRVEAQALADAVLVVIDGRTHQWGSPVDVFERPATLEAARAVGVENLLEGTVLRTGASATYVDLGAVTVACAPMPGLHPGTPVTLAVRAEHVEVRSVKRGASGNKKGLAVSLREVRAEGPLRRVLCDGPVPLTAFLPERQLEGVLAAAGPIEAVIDPSRCHLIPRDSHRAEAALE